MIKIKIMQNKINKFTGGKNMLVSSITPAGNNDWILFRFVKRGIKIATANIGEKFVGSPISRLIINKPTNNIKLLFMNGFIKSFL